MILQDAVRLTSSVQLQNYKNYTACLETLGRAINRPPYFWKNLSARAIYHPSAKYSLKGLNYAILHHIIIILAKGCKIYLVVFFSFLKILDPQGRGQSFQNSVKRFFPRGFWDDLFGGGNLGRSDFGDLNLFQC